MDELFVGPRLLILIMFVPMIIGVLVGALIIIAKDRKDRKERKEEIKVFVRFKNDLNFSVSCEKKGRLIYCPLCSFKNESPYRLSKHLKGHFKKGEGKNLFITQTEI